MAPGKCTVPAAVRTVDDVPPQISSRPQKRVFAAVSLVRPVRGELTLEERRLLRQRYIHLSAHWNAAKNFNSSSLEVLFINRPAKDNRRGVRPNE